jgi:hypothetical protein
MHSTKQKTWSSVSEYYVCICTLITGYERRILLHLIMLDSVDLSGSAAFLVVIT